MEAHYTGRQHIRRSPPGSATAHSTISCDIAAMVQIIMKKTSPTIEGDSCI